jgi:hypothetical protein
MDSPSRSSGNTDIATLWRCCSLIPTPSPMFYIRLSARGERSSEVVKHECPPDPRYSHLAKVFGRFRCGSITLGAGRTCSATLLVREVLTCLRSSIHKLMALEVLDALRGVVHASRVFDPSRTCTGSCGVCCHQCGRLRQVCDQLADSYTDSRPRAFDESGDHRIGAHNALSTVDELREAATLLDVAEGRLCRRRCPPLTGPRGRSSPLRPVGCGSATLSDGHTPKSAPLVEASKRTGSLVHPTRLNHQRRD